jgi:nitroreductase
VDVLEAIATRRSIGRLQPDEPSREVLEALLDAAVMAPNHHETQPWRFFVLTGGAREVLGDVMAEALRARMEGQDEARLNAMCEAEKTKPLRAPVIIAVACKAPQVERIVPLEDQQACAAAVQNLLLAAHALGLGAQWRTGDAVYDDRVKAHFGLEPIDCLVGFVYVGLPQPDFTPKGRAREFAAVTEWWN